MKVFTLFPIAAYAALVLVSAHGITRIAGGSRHAFLAYALPIAFFLPLPPVFMADAFAHLAVTRTALLTAAGAVALLTQLLAVRLAEPPAPLASPLDSASPVPWRSPRALVLAALALSVLVFFCLGPLFGYDAFLYHLPIAEDLLRTGHLPADPTGSIFDLPVGYPPLVYLANGSLWILEGAREHVTPRLLAMAFHFGFVMLLAVELGGAVGLAAAWLAATAPGHVEFAHAVGTDLPLAYFGLAWGLRSAAYITHRRTPDLILAALCLALALWIKYQALTIWAAGLLAIAAIARRDPHVALRLAGAHVLAMAAFLPFLARNALILGNPLFPAFADQLGGAGLDAWTLTHLASHVRSGAGLALLLSGLLWLGLCPALWLLLLTRPTTPAERFLRVTCWTATLLWLVLWVRPASMPGRFLLPILGLGAALAAPHWLELERSPRSTPLLPRLISLLVLAQAAWIAGTLVFHVAAPQEPPQRSAYRALAFLLRDGHPALLALALIAHRARATLATRRLLVAALAVPLVFQCLDKQRWLVQKLLRHGWIADRSFDPDRIEYAYLARLPPSSQVLAIGGLPDLLPRGTLHLESRSQRDLLEAATQEDVIRALASRGITHVFVDEIVASTIAIYRTGRFRSWLEARPRLLHEPGRTSIYEVAAPGSGR